MTSQPAPIRQTVLPTVKEMVAELDRAVVGQAQAKLDLATAIYTHYLLLQMNEADGGGPPPRQNLMLFGPTGSGKTHMIRTICGALDVPVVTVTATRFVEAGYAGDRVESILVELMHAAEGSRARAERGIVFIDEIDKIRRNAGGGRDIGGEGVQNALLAILDGGEMSFEYGKGDGRAVLDVSKVLFICAGAFVRLPEVIRERLRAGEPRGFGFARRKGRETAPAKTVDELTTHELLRHWEIGDLREFGLIAEFAGRFATVTTLSELTVDELVRLVDGVLGAPLEAERERCRLHGIDLVFEEDAKRAIAEEAMRLRTGARGLKRAVLRAVDPIDYRLVDLAREGVSRVVFGRAAAEGREPPRLERGNAAPDASMAEELRKTALEPGPARLDLEEPIDGARLRLSTFVDMPEAEREKLFQERNRQLASNLKPGSTVAQWWKSVCERRDLSTGARLLLVEELLLRQATVEQCYRAFLSSRTGSIIACLHRLDVERFRAWRMQVTLAHEQGAPIPEAPESWPDDLLREAVLA